MAAAAPHMAVVTARPASDLVPRFEPVTAIIVGAVFTVVAAITGIITLGVTVVNYFKTHHKSKPPQAVSVVPDGRPGGGGGGQGRYPNYGGGGYYQKRDQMDAFAAAIRDTERDAPHNTYSDFNDKLKSYLENKGYDNSKVVTVTDKRKTGTERAWTYYPKKDGNEPSRYHDIVRSAERDYLPSGDISEETEEGSVYMADKERSDFNGYVKALGSHRLDISEL